MAMKKLQIQGTRVEGLELSGTDYSFNRHRYQGRDVGLLMYGSQTCGAGFHVWAFLRFHNSSLQSKTRGTLFTYLLQYAAKSKSIAILKTTLCIVSRAQGGPTPF